MSAEGFDRLIRHYEADDDARLKNATVEDIALLVSLRASHAEGTPEHARLAFAADRAARWVEIANSPDPPPVEVVRLQPLLRRFIESLAMTEAGGLSPDAALGEPMT